MAGIENVSIIEETLPPFAYEFSFIPSAYYFISGKQSINSRIVFMIIGNIIAFIPFGFALPIVGRHMLFPKTLLIGITISLIIELVQPFIYGRSGDVDDLICNSLGTIIGYVLYLLMAKYMPNFLRKCKSTAK